MNTKLVRREDKFSFVWPPGNTEHFEFADTYEVFARNQPEEVHVAYGQREAFGDTRRRIIAFIGDPLWPAIEFAGTDSYVSDRSLVWPVKKPGGNKQYTLSESPHPDFARSRLVPFRNHVTGPHAFRGWAILLHEDQVDDLLSVA